ncbi:PAS domain S-box protein, partial [Candidatus Bipolaricaulota bacterium]|nr:PAS domain S-box protein [Candidatus Bipolaricaulota bacterium]
MEEERSPKSEISFEKLAETSPAAIIEVDKDGQIVYANDRAEEVLGLEKSEITNRTYDDPDWKITDFEGNTFPSEKLPFQIVKRTEEPVDDVRHAIEWQDSERKLLSVNASPLFDEDDEFDGMVSVIEDITEQVRTRRSLEESKKRYRQLFTETNEGVALHELIYDEEGKPVDYRILEINSNFESILGLTEEEVERKRATEYHGQERPPYLSRLAKVAKTGEPLTFETYHEPLNKHFRISIFSPGEDKVATAFTDITERVRNEERKDYLNSVLRSIRNVNQLLVSEKEVDTLIENICDVLTETRGYHNVWIALLDESNQLITAAESGLGNDFKPMLKRLEEGNFPARTKKTLNTSGPIVTQDPPEDCGDCPLVESYEGRSSITARLEHAGNVYGIIAASIPSKFADEEQELHLFEEVAGDIALGLHDIEIEEELQKSKERYQKYFDKTGDAIFILKMGGKNHGKILDVNSSAVEQTGYSREELLGMNMLEDLALEPPPDADLDEIDSSLSRGETVQFTEKKERKDGTEYWTEVVVTPLEHEGEQANLSINRDITERKKALSKLQQKEKEMSVLFSNLPGMAYKCENNKDWTMRFVSQGAEELTGHPPP